MEDIILWKSCLPALEINKGRWTCTTYGYILTPEYWSCFHHTHTAPLHEVVSTLVWFIQCWRKAEELNPMAETTPRLAGGTCHRSGLPSMLFVFNNNTLF